VRHRIAQFVVLNSLSTLGSSAEEPFDTLRNEKTLELFVVARGLTKHVSVFAMELQSKLTIFAQKIANKQRVNQASSRSHCDVEIVRLLPQSVEIIISFNILGLPRGLIFLLLPLLAAFLLAFTLLLFPELLRILPFSSCRILSL
jgi:hypothetical protein